MEIKSNIGYEQLIAIINQLPIDEVNRLKAGIEKFQVKGLVKLAITYKV